MTSDWCRYDAAARRLVLTLHVQPNAKSSAVVGPYGDSLKVKIAAPAVDSKANTALIELLSEALGVPRAVIAIRHGISSQRKIVEVSAGPETIVRAKSFAADLVTGHRSRVTSSTSK